MTETPVFRVEVHQNRYLPAGGTVVEAVVTVTASGSGGRITTAAPSAAQVIMIDCSGSMDDPPSKMAEAKKATLTAIDALPDGVAFAVIAGRSDAAMVYPSTTTLAPASRRTRSQAGRAVSRLIADGGTAVSTWLDLANMLFKGCSAEIKHAIMLTDGRNEHEPPEELTAVLQACEGRFVCDARGVGDDWSGTELRAVASALLGTADGLARPSDLVADFRTMTEAAMSKVLAEVSLRVWTTTGSTVRSVSEVYPQVEDLTDRRTEVSGRIGDYPTGAWGAENREYLISIGLLPGAVGEERLAARVSFISQDQTLVESRVTATWTADYALSAEIHPQVAHYSGQAELAVAIQGGLAARDRGDVNTATAWLGRALQLAVQTGRKDTADMLHRIVEVVEPRSGEVRLRTDATGVDAELANVRSVKTIRRGNG
jgi:hypothetical protein